jgi:hypothetical protein
VREWVEEEEMGRWGGKVRVTGCLELAEVEGLRSWCGEGWRWREADWIVEAMFMAGFEAILGVVCVGLEKEEEGDVETGTAERKLRELGPQGCKKACQWNEIIWSIRQTSKSIPIFLTSHTIHRRTSIECHHGFR